MPMHSSSLQTRTRRRSLSCAIGANSPALVTMSGTERIYSMPLALIAAMMPAPLSWRGVAPARVAVASILTLPAAAKGRQRSWDRGLVNPGRLDAYLGLMGGGLDRLDVCCSCWHSCQGRREAPPPPAVYDP